MILKALFMVITLFGVLFWFLTRRPGQNPPAANQAPEAAADQPERDLTGEQAAEVAATWTLLNPPS